MPSNNDKAKTVYKFLIQAEKQEQIFTLEEIANLSGWSLRTVHTYRSKKWHSFLQAVDNGYKCSGICNISEDAFLRIQAQRTHIEGDILRPRYSPNVDCLLERVMHLPNFLTNVHTGEQSLNCFAKLPRGRLNE